MLEFLYVSQLNTKEQGMKVEKRRNFLINLAFFAVILGLAYIGVKYLVPALLPFVIGLIIAVSFKGFIDKVSNRSGIKRSYISIIVLIVFYAIFALLIVLIGDQLISLIQDNAHKVPGFYRNTLEPFLLDVAHRFLEKFPDIEYDIDGIIEEFSTTIYSYISTATSAVLAWLATFATRIPVFIVNSVFAIVSSFFFTIDYHDITEFVFRQLPEEKAIQARGIKGNVVVTIWKYIKSYAFLMSITFVELTIGLIILGIPNPFAVSALVSIIDILPVLGTGTVLIPWSIIGFILGNYKIGFGMMVLYLIITAVRQTLEPKIIGKQIGLHPVVTVIGIFVGAKLFGLIGMFLLPITISILKRMNDEGAIHLFK